MTVNEDDESIVSYSPRSGAKGLLGVSPFVYDEASNDWLVSSPIKLDEAGNILSFWLKSVFANGNNIRFRVLVTKEKITSEEDFDESKFEEVSPGTVQLYDYLLANRSTEWRKFSYSLDAYANEEIQIAINNVSQGHFWGAQPFGSGYSTLLDDIEIISGGCLEQEAKNIQINVTHSSSVITWKGEAYSYKIEYGEKGFQLGKGEIVSTNDKSSYIRELTPNTVYQIYFRGYQAEEIRSEVWVGPYEFYTDATAIYPEEGYTYSFENGDFNEEGWRARGFGANNGSLILSNDRKVPIGLLLQMMNKMQPTALPIYFIM